MCNKTELVTPEGPFLFSALGGAQAFLLALCSGVTAGSTERTKYGTEVSHMQGRSLSTVLSL